MTKRNIEFAHAVTRYRELGKISRTDLATRSFMDASYITLIEKHGYVPKPDKVKCLADALGLGKESTDILMVTAGYAPVYVPVVDMIHLVRSYHSIGGV